MFIMGRIDDVINVAGHRLSTGTYAHIKTNGKDSFLISDVFFFGNPALSRCSVFVYAGEMEEIVAANPAVAECGLCCDIY